MLVHAAWGGQVLSRSILKQEIKAPLYFGKGHGTFFRFLEWPIVPSPAGGVLSLQSRDRNMMAVVSL